jgi:LacI family transcriptional regulator
MQVIGFQNTRYSELSRPKLTCINNPIYEIGEKSMDLLTKLMEQTLEEGEDLHEYIPYEIIWRDSTK